ncbi:MAG: carbohydrate kinase family protein [Dehalococcoidia bacterium]|nr:carbohydrate kinase family protein [Dehalococcoidia bacterium]
MIDVIGFGAINVDETYFVPSLTAVSGLRMLSGSEQTISRREYGRLAARLKKAGVSPAQSGGGQAANAAYALARLGFRTAMISSVGADPEGERLLADLAPVDVSQVLRGGRSARCVVIVDESGERTLRVLPAADPPALDPVATWRSLGGARCLHITSLARAGELATQLALVKALPDDVTLSFDPGELYCRLGTEALAPVLKRTDVLFLNEREAELLTGKPTFDGCYRLLRREGAVVAGKKGRRGVEIIGRDERFELPARVAAAVDPTGAGDVFAAGFLAGLLLDLDLRRCAVLGSEAAARSVTGYGRAGYPGRELLETLRPAAPVEPRAKGGPV